MKTKMPDMVARVLEEDWRAYDDRKCKAGLDPNFFDYRQGWETEFMSKLIASAYRKYNLQKIKTAIEGCCLMDKGPHPRGEVVACVLRRLQLK